MDIYSMGLHDVEDIDKYGISILRVPGGWIYSFAQTTTVFVPFHSEFKRDVQTSNIKELAATDTNTGSLQLLLNKYLDTSPGVSISNRDVLQVFVLWAQQQQASA